MTATTATEQLIEEYLDRLATATRTLPKTRRDETLAEIREHISVTLSQSKDQDEATVRTILDRLGAPEDIAREAGADLDSAPRATGRRVGAFEVVTVILLLIGGIVLPVLGWVIGVVLLWASARWTTRDKVIGTLVVPGGLGVAAWYVLVARGTSTCSADGTCHTSGPSPALGLALVLIGTVASIASAAYLLRRATSTR